MLFPLIQMINALVIARHSDPAANEVIRVLEDHTAGNFSHNKVPLFILRFFFYLSQEDSYKFHMTPIPSPGSELHH